jgi:uncharacterized membrane protein (UPF0182 family)
VRGNLLVIPSDAVLLYAEPIYLQAEHPCPNCGWSCSLQDRLAFGDVQAAMAGLFGQSLPTAQARRPRRRVRANVRGFQQHDSRSPGSTRIRDAGRDLASTQRLTAEGKLGEAGPRLQASSKLDRLQRAPRK